MPSLDLKSIEKLKIIYCRVRTVRVRRTKNFTVRRSRLDLGFVVGRRRKERLVPHWLDERTLWMRWAETWIKRRKKDAESEIFHASSCSQTAPHIVSKKHHVSVCYGLESCTNPGLCYCWSTVFQYYLHGRSLNPSFDRSIEEDAAAASAKMIATLREEGQHEQADQVTVHTCHNTKQYFCID